MAYIGKTPVVGNFQVCDAISVVNGQAAYTLQVGSANVIPQSANHMIVSLNGVIQKPGSSFTVSGSVMTFASNLATGDSIDFVQILGNVLDIGTPSDATVTSAKLNLTSAVGIGESSPGTLLDIKGPAGANNRITLNSSDAGSNAQVLGGIVVENQGDSVVQISGRRESATDDGYFAIETQATGGSLTERVRIHSGGVMSATQGIALGVGTANTSSNVLDDYEEGTWTGTISDGTNNATMSSNTGGYIKIGSLVVLTGYFVVSSLGSVSGNLRLTGLPFACGSSNAFYTSNGLGWGANLSITDDTSIGFQIDTNASHLNFTHWDNASGTTLLQSSELSGDGQFMMNLSYRTDA